MKAEYIYPSIKTEVYFLADEKKFHIKLSTILRKCGTNGKYYRWEFSKDVIIGKGPDLHDAALIALIHFNSAIYENIILGKVSDHLVSETNSFIYVPDIDQRSEEERLKDRLVNGE